jgi:hypothetical protein
MKIEKKESEMSERPTPETDDAQWGTGKVTTDFARRLERERDEARAELEMWRDGNILHEIHRDELQKVERERDAWREMAVELADAAACGLAQWDDGCSPEVSRKIGDSIMRFQKMQKGVTK